MNEIFVAMKANSGSLKIQTSFNSLGCMYPYQCIKILVGVQQHKVLGNRTYSMNVVARSHFKYFFLQKRKRSKVVIDFAFTFSILSFNRDNEDQ